jgi:uncharacterized protein YdaU (DUF1376 family)
MADYPGLTIWTDAYLADTRHLSTAEHGAYLLMLMTAWRTPDCSLPNDDKYLGVVVGDSRNWPKWKVKILPFWTVGEDGRLRQKRLTSEREFVETRRRLASEAGKASALKRKDSGSTPVGFPLQPKANPHTHTNNTLSKDKAAGPPQEGLTTLFGEVLPGVVEWGVTERQARSLLGKLLKEHLASDILDAFHASAGKADPVAYMRAVLAKRGGKPSEDPELNQLRQQAKMLAKPTPFAKSQAQRLPSGAIPKMVKLGLLPAETAAEYGVKS